MSDVESGNAAANVIMFLQVPLDVSGLDLGYREEGTSEVLLHLPLRKKLLRHGVLNRHSYMYDLARKHVWYQGTSNIIAKHLTL